MLRLLRPRQRDKDNLNIFWLKGESLDDSANLPASVIIAAEIMESLQAAREQFSEIAADRGSEGKPATND